MRAADTSYNRQRPIAVYRRQRLVAAIALLQPGIDPIFLMLLSHHSGLAIADHGLVVAASQAGMAAGALLFATMRRLPASALRWAAFGALLASLGTVWAPGLAALLGIRTLFGACTGLIYAAALSAATRRDPGHAMGTVLLAQLVMATAVALLLPQITARAGTGTALAALAGFAAFNLWRIDARDYAPRTDPALPAAAGRSTPAAIAVFLFVAGSMMVWSYMGAEGMATGLSEGTVGIGVALGSVAGGVAALLVALASRRGWPPLPLVLAGALCALAMLSPFAAPAGAAGFAAVMILFNIGATYSVAAFSAHAIGRGGAMRRLVPALQSSAMVVGPALAAAAMHGGGFGALARASAGIMALGVVALAADSRPHAASQQNLGKTVDEVLTQS